ncbi:MAG: FAD-binding oxidoreductase [Chromatiales bacterium]|jgi:FAD-dependent oxidoreductase domain-containing protein 1|nr:FAD-binding oxidoreductase [Chromatiales bacterium]
MGKIIVIGGSIMGSSLAYHMAIAGHAKDVVVVEPDPTYEWAAAPRSAGGIRLMYSLPENIEMSRYGRKVYQNYASLMDVDGQPGVFAYREHGYLYLASGAAAIGGLEESYRVQSEQGVDNEMLDRAELKQRFPYLHTDDLDAGLFGPRDGSIDPHAAVTAVRRKAVSLGVEYIQDRVVGLDVSGKRVSRVRLASGQVLDAQVAVNVAGAWAPEICAMAGMKVPVEPLSRHTFYFETEGNITNVPLTKDTSGLMFRPEGGGFATGLTREGAAPGFQWDIGQADHDDFEANLWPKLAHRVHEFERLKVKRAWAGHYAMNLLDGNAIVGPWIGGAENFYVAIGFSGAGLQKGPAIGRALTELLLHGQYQSIDLSRLSYQRVIDGKPLVEVGFKA